MSSVPKASFRHGKTATVDVSVLAATLKRRGRDVPAMAKYDLPDFMYSRVRFEDRPRQEEYMKHEHLMLDLSLLGQALRCPDLTGVGCTSIACFTSQCFYGSPWLAMLVHAGSCGSQTWA
jgi:hypothetical protein